MPFEGACMHQVKDKSLSAGGILLIMYGTNRYSLSLKFHEFCSSFFCFKFETGFHFHQMNTRFVRSFVRSFVLMLANLVLFGMSPGSGLEPSAGICFL